jgi:hypothetical protein
MPNDFEAWLRELAAAGNEVVDRWESGDLAEAVNELRRLLEEGGYRSGKPLTAQQTM